MTTAQKNFIDRVGKMAQADMARSGILASLSVAQAIIESGWGNSGLTRSGNALFGIKAGTSWKGPRLSCKTFEYYDGKRTDITDAFRAYGSWEESVADHSAFLRGLGRYKAVVGEKDYKKACRAIHAAGYATAPNYADALISLIEQYGLTKWDACAQTPAKPVAPAPAPAKPSPPPAQDCFEYTIKSGKDTLWALAVAYLGAGSRWTEIQKLNGGIDPKKLQIGMKIKIPGK
jgi:hypothetical protein